MEERDRDNRDRGLGERDRENIERGLGERDRERERERWERETKISLHPSSMNYNKSWWHCALS